MKSVVPAWILYPQCLWWFVIVIITSLHCIALLCLCIWMSLTTFGIHGDYSETLEQACPQSFTVSLIQLWKDDHSHWEPASVWFHVADWWALFHWWKTHGVQRSLLISGCSWCVAQSMDLFWSLSLGGQSSSQICPLQSPLATDCYLATQWRLPAPLGRRECACQQECIGGNRGRWRMEEGD